MGPRKDRLFRRADRQTAKVNWKVIKPGSFKNGLERLTSRYAQSRREKWNRDQHRRVRTSGHLASFFHRNSTRQFKRPFSIQLPQRLYPRLPNNTEPFRHRDILGRRYSSRRNDDRYLDPIYGSLSKVVLQAPSDLYDRPNDTTWQRTYVKNVSPLVVQMAIWTRSHFKAGAVTPRDYWIAAAKWLPACFAILLAMIFPVHTGDTRNNGNYDSFPYSYDGYPRASSNELEDESHALNEYSTPDSSGGDNPQAENDTVRQGVVNRVLRPCRLQVLRNPARQELSEDGGHDLVQHPHDNLQYLFVAFAAEQFPAPSKREFGHRLHEFRPMREGQLPETDEYREYVRQSEALRDLHDLGEKAAREAGIPAFWISSTCMNEDDNNEVYRINDIIRGASKVVIALGHRDHNEESDYGLGARRQLLKDWGKRVWTFPETLLANQDSDILVYTRNLVEPKGLSLKPEAVPRNQFANLVWTDAWRSRDLMDHFSGRTTLSRLELPLIALRCLLSRELVNKKTGKPYFFPGDRAYALSGLLRRRPEIVGDDTPFQAFARLSLANDSDRLLERLICMLPMSPDQDWQLMEDWWNANLWNIEPECQVAAIGDKNGDNDTVIITGARAATVRWQSFAPVASERSKEYTTRVQGGLLHITTVGFGLGIVLTITGHSLLGNIAELLGIGISLIVVAAISMLFFPVTILKIYSGKQVASQAWLFGVEGYLDIETIETKIFGSAEGRLKWAPFGSILSGHKANEYKEREGIDPRDNRKTCEVIRQAEHAAFGDQKVFTLVDTVTMSVTVFLARRPPVVFLITGREGGRLRAVGCSYDWPTETLYRETVLRMDPKVKQRMEEVGQVRFGLKRETEDTERNVGPANPSSTAGSIQTHHPLSLYNGLNPERCDRSWLSSVVPKVLDGDWYRITELPGQ